MWAELLLGHAVHTAKVAPIGDREAEVAHGPTQRIAKGNLQYRIGHTPHPFAPLIILYEVSSCKPFHKSRCDPFGKFRHAGQPS